MRRDDLSSIGKRLRALRAEHGLTQRELADRAGMSTRFVSQLEAGGANVSVSRLADLARVLRVSMVTLLHGLGPEDDLDRQTCRLACLPANKREHILRTAPTPQRVRRHPRKDSDEGAKPAVQS